MEIIIKTKDRGQKLSSTRDLSRGERDYLHRQGVKMDKFDRMDAQSQHEWKEECKDLAYENNLKEYKYFKK